MKTLTTANHQIFVHSVKIYYNQIQLHFKSEDYLLATKILHKI